MKIEINLTPEDILDKNFSINLKGYDVKEVDYFLDLIKKDYEMWKLMQEQKENQIVELGKEREKLINKIKVLENHILRFRTEVKDLQNKGFSNIDIIQRLNKLEEKK